MKRNKLSSVLTASLIVGSAFIGSNAFAVGTDAGTAISNTATVSFTRAGNLDTEQATISFNVDEIINVNVTAANASTNITNGVKNAAIAYTVTNTGNGTELFKLLESINAGNNSLPLSANDLTVYFDTSPTPDGFDPNNINEQLYTDTDISIANDEFITVYIVTDVPNGAVLNAASDLLITAVSQTENGGVKASESLFGASITGAGTNGTNAIIATNLGRDSASSLLTVTTYDPSQALVVTINKSIMGSTAQVNNTATVTDQKIPGAIVTYFIKIVVANDTATALSISDIIPANMTYVAQSLRKQSAIGGTINTPTYEAPTLPAGIPVTYLTSNFSPLTDTNGDADGGETLPNTGTVTSIKVDFGDLAVGEYAILVDAKINN